MDPDMAGPIDPRPRRLAYFVHEIEVPAILGHIRRARFCAVLHAPILAGKFAPCAAAFVAANALNATNAIILALMTHSLLMQP